VLALCEYWLAAEFMRRQTHAIKDKWARARTRHWSEFRTYHSYWLSALYVVVEGFEKLGLDKDAEERGSGGHVRYAPCA